MSLGLADADKLAKMAGLNRWKMGTGNKQSSSVPVAKARPHWSLFAKIKIQDFITKNEKNI